MIFRKEHREHNNLIVEYEVLSDRIEDIVQIYWQAGSIFIGASITGLAIIGQFIIDGERKMPSIIVFIISLVFISIMTRWGDAADRWNSIVKIFYVRIREIETELGFWGNRYIDWVDNKDQKGYYYNTLIDAESKIGKEIQKNHYEGSVRNFRDDIVVVVSLGWFLLFLASIVIDIIYPNDFSIVNNIEEFTCFLQKLTTLNVFCICSEIFILIWIIVNTRGIKNKITNIGRLVFILIFLIIYGLIRIVILQPMWYKDIRFYTLIFIIPLSSLLKLGYGKIRKTKNSKNIFIKLVKSLIS